MRKLTSFIGIGGLAAIAMNTAGAASVSSLFFADSINLLSDNSAESQNVDVNGDGYLGQSDTMRGIFTIGTIEDAGGSGTNFVGSNGNNELTGLFEAEVNDFTITDDPDGSCGGSADCNGEASLSGDERATYSFEPHAAFASDNGFSAGTMIATYEDPNNDYTRSDSDISVNEASATNGSLFWELGMGQDADEGWRAIDAAVDPALGNSTPLGSGLGTFNISLSMLANHSGLQIGQVAAGCSSPGNPFPCGDDGLIDINGQGGIVGTSGSNTGYQLFNNVDFTVAVPAPLTLGLMGLGLMGLGLVGRRRSQQV